MPADMRDLEEEFSELKDLGKMDDLDKELRARGLEAGEPITHTKETLRILPISIAGVALLAFAGIVGYAYSTGVSSTNAGDVPLLTPEHAAKVLPDDPGGLKVPHQDKLVYNQMEPEVDDSQVERLLPPPEQPIKPPAAKPIVEAVESDTPPIPSITAPIKPKEKNSEPLLINPDAEEEAVTKATEVPKAVVQTSKVETPKKPEVTVSAPETKPVAPKVEEAPKPKAEPLQTAATAVINKAKDWRIQLGAMSSHRKAQEEYARQQKKNGDLLGKLALEVQQVKVNEKDYFRLRLGPLASQKDAKGLCGDLKKRGTDCIAVAPGK
ncbi:SPOR domain-containing protein [Curvivirga sp.]|uniref:SPOR domain-containing protein n=1 Tax=Curvivirga sp. TaxID=2856848 RepID=UPI003B5ABB51